MSAESTIICYICQKTIPPEQKQNCYALFTACTVVSNAKLVEKVSDIAHEPILVSENDVVCKKCFVLLNTIDRVESGLEKLRSDIRLQLESRYASYQLSQSISNVDPNTGVSTEQQYQLSVSNIVENNEQVERQDEVREIVAEIALERKPDISGQSTSSSKGLSSKRQSKVPSKYSDYETTLQSTSRTPTTDSRVLASDSRMLASDEDDSTVEGGDITDDVEQETTSNKVSPLTTRSHPGSVLSITLGVKGPEISSNSPAARLLKKYYPTKDLKSAESRKAALASFLQRTQPEKSHKKSILRQELQVAKSQADDGGWQCENCGKCFETRRALYQHSMREKGLVHKCKYCGQGFVSQSRWQKHEWEHTGVQGHVCEICGKLFQSKTGLRNHVAFHKGDYKYTCRTCGKGFCQKQNYLSHCAIHTGTKTFRCTVCNDYFRHYGSLWSHKILIHGQSKKKYKCQICSKEYSLPNHLSAHKKTHLEIKPYLCEFCHKRFTRPTTLKLHMSTHTKQYVFNCNMCDFHSNRKYRASVHLQNVHSIHPNIIKDSFNTLIKVHRRNLQEIQESLNTEEQPASYSQTTTVNTDDINQPVQPVVTQPYYETVYIHNVSEGTAPVIQAVRSLEIISSSGTGTEMMY